jgi:hypothetical protein
MANQFDLNKFNTVMSQASDAILCNSDCRQKRQSEKLKQNYQNAQTNLASASNQVQVAERNYVTFTQGEPAYNELQDNQLQQQAQIIADKFNENFNEETVKIKSQINTYNGLLINFKNIFDLERKYREENRELQKELKEETNDVLTNERKTYYQDQNIDSLKFYYYYFLLSIYVIFVICFAAFSLMYPSQTSWKVKLALLIGFIALPFISTWILGKIIYLIYEAYNLLPKNVYNKKTY